jgi:isoleucyl-tRNA synthetase
VGGGKELNVLREHLDIRIEAKKGFNVATRDNLYVVLNTTLSPDLIYEGLARELVSKIQQLRKSAGFDVADRIRVAVQSDDDVVESISRFGDYVASEVLAVDLRCEATTGESVVLNGHNAVVGISRV